MFPACNRRSFLAASTAFGFLESLPPVSAADAPANPKLVAFEPEIEPLDRTPPPVPKSWLPCEPERMPN